MSPKLWGPAGSGRRNQEANAYRKDLRARLAQTQADLLAPLLGLDPAQLASPPLPEGRSPAIILLDHGEGDRVATIALEELLGDKKTRTVPRQIGVTVDIDEVVHHFLAARRLLLDTLARVSDDALHCPRGGETPARIMEQRYVESKNQVAEIACWKSTTPARPPAGSRVLQVAALRAARKELLTTIALIPEDARPQYGLADGQTLRGHLMLLAAGDRELLAAPGSDDRTSMSPLSDESAWSTVWRDLHAARQHLLTAIETSQSKAPDISEVIQEHLRRRVEVDRSLAAWLRDSLGVTGGSTAD